MFCVCCCFIFVFILLLLLLLRQQVAFLIFGLENSCNNLVVLVVHPVPTSVPNGISVSVVYSLLCCLWETTHELSLAARMGTLLLWGS